MTDFFFDLPLWVPIALLAAAVAVFVYGNNRGDRRLRLASGGILALTAALVAISWHFETLQEKCYTRTKSIVNAVSAKQWDTVRDLMNESTRCVGLKGRDQIASTGKALAEEWGLKSAIVLASSPQPGAPGMMDMQVSVLHEFTRVSIPRTTWVFRYEKRVDGIELTSIDPVNEPGTPVGEIERRMK
ncbi:MAG: hypothetical protein QM770_18940 [Tepidisphaeraceae bacterium]